MGTVAVSLLASGALLPLLLAAALTLAIDGAILGMIWHCIGTTRPRQLSQPRPAGRKLVSRHFADAVARGDFAQAERGEGSVCGGDGDAWRPLR